jgi:hypothetical protein
VVFFWPFTRDLVFEKSSEKVDFLHDGVKVRSMFF